MAKMSAGSCMSKKIATKPGKKENFTKESKSVVSGKMPKKGMKGYK